VQNEERREGDGGVPEKNSPAVVLDSRWEGESSAVAVAVRWA